MPCGLLELTRPLRELCQALQRLDLAEWTLGPAESQQTFPEERGGHLPVAKPEQRPREGIEGNGGPV